MKRDPVDLRAPPPVAAPSAPMRQMIKFVSGGSRMGDSRRSQPNCAPIRQPNEDAFKVGNYCFAVADGFEGAPLASEGARAGRAASPRTAHSALLLPVVCFQEFAAARSRSGVTQGKERLQLISVPVGI